MAKLRGPKPLSKESLAQSETSSQGSSIPPSQESLPLADSVQSTTSSQGSSAQPCLQGSSLAQSKTSESMQQEM